MGTINSDKAIKAPPRVRSERGGKMRGMGGSRAERAGAARRARGRWTSVLGQPRGACHIHRHAILASCRGAAWCPHKSPDPQLPSLLQGAGLTEKCMVTRGGQSRRDKSLPWLSPQLSTSVAGGSGVGIVDARLQRPTNHDFHIGSETRHAV